VITVRLIQGSIFINQRLSLFCCSDFKCNLLLFNYSEANELIETCSYHSVIYVRKNFLLISDLFFRTLFRRSHDELITDIADDKVELRTDSAPPNSIKF
jgi:hypothetical protein